MMRSIQQSAILDGLQMPPGERYLPDFTLYDDVGTTLFEAITKLPEYDLCRAETSLLKAHAADIAQWVSSRTRRSLDLSSGAETLPSVSIVDLGCGSGMKSRVVAEAVAARCLVDFYAVDISAEALAICTSNISGVENVTVHQIHDHFPAALNTLDRVRNARAPMLLLFLGSSIGQFGVREVAPFLQSLAGHLMPGDGLLLGADGVRPEAEMYALYNDKAGVTQAFSKNSLNVVNRTLTADFDPRAFKFQVAIRADSLSQSPETAVVVIEKHLVSIMPQTVLLSAGNVRLNLAEGERLALPNSLKFTESSLAALVSELGLETLVQWRDPASGFIDMLMGMPYPSAFAVTVPEGSNALRSDERFVDH